MRFENMFSLRLFASFIAIASAAWLGVCATAPAEESSLPADVIGFVSRRGACDEWSQKAKDPTQAAQIDEITRALKCEDIKGDEVALRNSYAANPNVITALNGTWIKNVQRVQAPIGVLTGPWTRPSD
jgi:hypothetical protein